MLRKMLIGKIHNATVTEANKNYCGSITIDSAILTSAGILEYESVDVWNITNGQRFSTYAISGEEGSGVICINGAAAHKANVGDKIIICHFGLFEDEEYKLSIFPFFPLIVIINDESNIHFHMK